MKRTILYIFVFVLLIGLVGCRSSVPQLQEPSSPTPELTESPAPTEEPQADEQQDAEHDIKPVEKADAEEVFYFSNPLEFNRIYRQGLDGEGLTLICDENASNVVEMGEYIYFLREPQNKSELRRCPVTGGQSEQVLDKHILAVQKLSEDVLVLTCYEKTEGREYNTFALYTYNIYSEELKLISGQTDFVEYGTAANGRLVYQEYVFDTGATRVFVYDLESDESSQLMENSDSYLGRMTLMGDVLFLNDNDLWTEYDLRTMQMKSSDFMLEAGDKIIHYDGETVWAINVESNSVVKISGGDRMLLFKGEENFGIYAEEVKENNIIFRTSVFREAVGASVEYWMYEDLHYYSVSAESDEVKEITAVGELGQLFKDGDFPIIDTSTARKPLTNDIADLFVRRYGFEGASPLCSTTHFAWLNFADGGADVALLAAPTDEEKAYLEEKNVEIEMKAYGGDALVFIGGSASGVDSLTAEQIRAIYRGEITNWKEVGGVDHEIEVMYRDDQSGSQRLFESLVWKGEEIPDFGAMGFYILDDMSTIVMMCQDNPYAIGYTIMTYLDDVFGQEGVCVYSIDGSQPNVENVANGSYPFNTRGYVIIRKNEPEDSPARRLYNWFGCPVSDDILLQNNIIPLS